MLDKLVRELKLNSDNMLEVQAEISKRVADFQVALATAQAKEVELRTAILNAMEDTGEKKFEDEYIKVTYVAAQARQGIDTAKLRSLRPDIAQEFLKITPVKSSVRITIKEY